VAVRRRCALRWLRWERPLDGRDAADPRPDPAADAADADSAARLARALNVLPRRQRELLHLVFYEQLSIREAAGLLGISVGSARTHYERGKHRLRETLDGEGW
jgi:RNA polymerase sigma factor (sigma-70 family)